MTDRISERSDGGGRGKRLGGSATAAASTFALALPFVLPTIALAHASGKRGLAAHPIAPHAAKFSSHGHHTSPSHPADLTWFSAVIEFSVTPVSGAAAIQPHARLTPTASARGPPNAAHIS